MFDYIKEKLAAVRTFIKKATATIYNAITVAFIFAIPVLTVATIIISVLNAEFLILPILFIYLFVYTYISIWLYSVWSVDHDSNTAATEASVKNAYDKANVSLTA